MPDLRIKIGDSPDADLPAHVDSIIQALKDGHRHLVFTSPEIPFNKTLDLDHPDIRAGDRFLRFDGGAVDGVVFEKTQSLNGPMVKAHEGSFPADQWRMIWDGITLDGKFHAENLNEAQHLVDVRWLEKSYFLSCVFRRAGGYGALFGWQGDTSAVTFRRCEFVRNQWHGCYLQNSRDFVFGDMCVFRQNQLAGVTNRSELLIHDDATHTSTDYGFGLIEGCLFTRVGEPLGRGLLVSKARRLRVIGNRWRNCQIETQPGTEDSYFGWNSVNNGGASLFFNCLGTGIIREHNDVPGCP